MMAAREVVKPVCPLCGWTLPVDWKMKSDMEVKAIEE
jgi:hypothetical protein